MEHKRFWYLASPYAKYRDGHKAAYLDVLHDLALLVSNGINAFSPIVHNYPVERWGVTGDHEFWLSLDLPFIVAAKGLIVCQLPGWKESTGVTWEIEKFQAMHKPVVYMKPGVLPYAFEYASNG